MKQVTSINKKALYSGNGMHSSDDNPVNDILINFRYFNKIS